jgi:REP element-mobilizing transposase RayT
MGLNEPGKFTQKCWLNIPNYFPHVHLGEFIITPNHIHGIIVIQDEKFVAAKII